MVIHSTLAYQLRDMCYNFLFLPFVCWLAFGFALVSLAWPNPYFFVAVSAKPFLHPVCWLVLLTVWRVGVRFAKLVVLVLTAFAIFPIFFLPWEGLGCQLR